VRTTHSARTSSTGAASRTLVDKIATVGLETRNVITTIARHKLAAKRWIEELAINLLCEPISFG